MRLKSTFLRATFTVDCGKRFNAKAFASISSPADSEKVVKSQHHFNRGVEHWNLNDMNSAKTEFKQSISVLPSSDAYFNLANVYHNSGETEKAVEYWLKSIDLSPRADAHVNIANVLAIMLKNIRESIPHYEKALELSPEDGEIHYNFGVVLDANGDLEKAMEQYQIAVKSGIEPAEKNLRNARAKYISKLAQNGIAKKDQL